MLLVFTSDELERLAKRFSAKKPSIEFLGTNRLRVKASSVNIKLFLEDVQPRRLTFSYKINAFINFFAERFVKFERPGLIWEKETNLIHLDLDQMPQDDKTKDFFFRQIIIDEQKLIVDFDLYQDLEQ
jgi:hypothetical protein